MSNPDQVSYGRRARLRTAISSQAADVADRTRGLVPTYADGYANGGEFVDAAAAIAADARRLLELAVAYERRRGTSWEVIGEALGVSRQGAHDRFAAAVNGLDDEIVRCWLLGDDPRHIGLPDGAADTAGTADILDRWVIRHLEATDPLAHKPEDDPERQHPVSHNLPPMDALENSNLVLAGVTMLNERIGVVPDDWDEWNRETHRLNVGLARRKIEFYERLLTEEVAGKRTGTPADQLRDQLAGARARLAELDAPRTCEDCGGRGWKRTPDSEEYECRTCKGEGVIDAPGRTSS